MSEFEDNETIKKESNNKQRIDEIVKQIKEIDLQLPKLEEEIIKFKNIINNFQNNINNLQIYLSKLVRTLNDEYMTVQEDKVNIHKKLNRSIKYLDGVVKYRYDKRKNMSLEVNDEINNLIGYIGNRFSNVSKIEDLKKHIKKTQIKIVELQNELVLNQNKLNDTMAVYNNLDMEKKKLQEEQDQIIKEMEADKLEIERQNQENIENKEQLGGKKRKSRKRRKHKGINSKTGKLKKGYKYSGKKLKSGLPEIIKIKNKKKSFRISK